MDFDICFLTVIIICINYHEWLVKNCLCSKDCLPCSPWFCTVCRFLKSFREIIQRLEYIFHITDFLDTVSDNSTEIFLQVFSDNENNFIKTCLYCIMNGIIHNDLAGRSYRLQLLDSSSETASNSSCHNN